MGTRKQNKARKRNWAKSRLIGSMAFDMSAFTLDEQISIKQILKYQKELLKHWDKNTEKHLGIKLKPFMCELCNKRLEQTEVFTLESSQLLVCKKHYLEMIS
jgi:hypothetical protein